MASKPMKQEVPPKLQATVEALCSLSAQGPVALLCEPSPEGVLTGVGLIYLAHATTRDVRLARADDAQLHLGEERLSVSPNMELAQRVNAGLIRALRQKEMRPRENNLGGRPFVEWTREDSAVYACCCDDITMPQDMYEFARLAFSNQHIANLEQTPQVARYRELVSFAWGELEHVRQFVRFSRMSDGTFMAVFRPRANVVALALSSFAQRMAQDRFCVLDPVHRVAALYDGTEEIVGPAHAMWDGSPGKKQAPRGKRALVRLTTEDARALERRDDYAEDEQYVRALWKRFYDAMELPGRGPQDRGYDLRASWEPKRFWAGLTEMDPQNDNPGSFVPQRYRGGSDR